VVTVRLEDPPCVQYILRQEMVAAVDKYDRPAMVSDLLYPTDVEDLQTYCRAHMRDAAGKD
jgi:hypothetical protein